MSTTTSMAITEADENAIRDLVALAQESQASSRGDSEFDYRQPGEKPIGSALAAEGTRPPPLKARPPPAAIDRSLKATTTAVLFQPGFSGLLGRSGRRHRGRAVAA